MSLTGTFDVFSFPEVLRMLATAGKSGTLTVETAGRSATVELYEGECCGASQDGVDEPLVADHTPAALHARLLDVAFDGGAQREGVFRFSADEHPRPRPAACTAVEPVLEELEQIEREWHDIATVVPSTDAVPVLAPRLAGDEITINALEWSLLACLDGQTAVRDLPGRAGSSLVGVCRALAALVRRGAIDVAPAVVRAPAAVVAPAAAVEPQQAPAAPRVEPVIDPVIDPAFEAAPQPVEALEAVIEAVIETTDEPEAEVEAEAADGGTVSPAGPEPVEGDRGAMLRLFSALRE